MKQLEYLFEEHIIVPPGAEVHGAHNGYQFDLPNGLTFSVIQVAWALREQVEHFEVAVWLTHASNRQWVTDELFDASGFDVIGGLSAIEVGDAFDYAASQLEVTK